MSRQDEIEMVDERGQCIGYGNLMHTAEQQWRATNDEIGRFFADGERAKEKL